MGLFRKDSTAESGNFAEDLFLAADFNANMITSAGCCGGFGCFIDLNSFLEPEPSGRNSAIGAGDFHLEYFLKKTDSLLKVCGVDTDMV